MSLLNKPIKVLVVDDSAVVRKILERELNAKEGIQVVGTAADPYIAREQIVRLNPDVLTLDIEMPRMDGLAFLRKLMAARPMPVIVVSSLGERGGPVALEALELGAFEVVRKPGSSYTVQEACGELATLIRHARSFRPQKRLDTSPARAAHVAPSALSQTTHKILAIGASTGGVQALQHVFTQLPATAPGIVVVQHMPPKFTSLFAQRLNTICAMQVKEAVSGDRVLPGHILIAPGGKHMTLTRSGAQYQVLLNEDAPVCRQRPSVDVLFHSVAKFAGSNAVGAILTGMGNDGAAGMLAMHRAGAQTIAQDEDSCVVFGMPKEAIKAGGVDHTLPLNQIAGKLLDLANRQSIRRENK
ncbi:MAG: chemotaxis response regulator protein-glutamate methylesterase [Pontiellaceae bacterium]|nr:chemotaxis response regulator protein-glutamate methylesterase [Pontiellaceae bacterium]MBN2785807.1 chemotaxis response regulator protein-glutamate methylesterase [Pontiellaceae bacterium]